MESYLDIIGQVFNNLMLLVQVMIIVVTVYYFVLSVFSMYRKKENKDFQPINKFAVVVAAHNEEPVIGPLVDNLKELDYPEELYDIFVVADNCSDKTALISKNKGAYVYERFNEINIGKGHALEWLFNKIFLLEKKYDAVVIFDADNLVKKNFLAEMNAKLCQGEQIVQGYIDSKNPMDTWVTNSFSIAFWLMNRLIQLGRYNMGISNVLAGTGMCISTEVLKKFGWGAHSLTEDLEFTMKALSNGVKTSWAHDAVVYDEKPLKFMQSCRQRKRWAQGQIDVASRYLLILLIRGLKERKQMYFDAVIHLFQPYFLVITTAFLAVQVVPFLQQYYTNLFLEVIPWYMWQIVSVGITVFMVIAMILDKVPLKAYRGLILYPVFMYSWVPIIIVGFIHRNNKDWSHTKHTRSISYSEMITEEKVSAN